MPSTAHSRYLLVFALLALSALWSCAAEAPLGDATGTVNKDATAQTNLAGETNTSSDGGADATPGLGDGTTGPTTDALACEGPSPEGCATVGCEEGSVCNLEAECAPSYCVCDPDMGIWLCSMDCGGGVCVAEGAVWADSSSSSDPGGGTSMCSEPNPVGCVETGCPPGRKCDLTAGCAPSWCSCNPNDDTWVCTDDCGGGICVPKDALPCLEPDPTGCMSTGCATGLVCDKAAGCAPTECWCDATTGTWGCAPDCEGGVCVDPQAQKECTKTNPVGCAVSGCPDKFECDPKLGCAPSSCDCDTSSGEWACTGDCNGGICKPKISTIPGCKGGNPEGCANAGCEPGWLCDKTMGCVSSSCVCDKFSGEWTCTDDCAGGLCVEKPAVECEAGSLAVNNQCMPCNEVDLIVNSEISEAINEYGMCSKDEDCVIVAPPSACYPGCPVAINEISTKLYETFMTNTSSKYCVGYLDSCGPAPDIICAAGDVPFCSENLCALKESL